MTCDHGCCPREVRDWFCGAGGAAEGLHRAWPHAHIVGYDIKPQPRYPFDFVQCDWQEAPLDGDFYWASPVCKRYSAANNIHGRMDHPDQIASVRGRLSTSGAQWVIENVPGAPLLNWVELCGLSFGLGVRRHRRFEASLGFLAPPHGNHREDYIIVFGNGGRGRAKQIGRTAKNGPILRRPMIGADRCREAMGIDWMTRDELSQAVPPAYSEYIARQLTPALVEAAA